MLRRAFLSSRSTAKNLCGGGRRTVSQEVQSSTPPPFTEEYEVHPLPNENKTRANTRQADHAIYRLQSKKRVGPLESRTGRQYYVYCYAVMEKSGRVAEKRSFKDCEASAGDFVTIQQSGQYINALERCEPSKADTDSFPPLQEATPPGLAKSLQTFKGTVVRFVALPLDKPPLYSLPQEVAQATNTSHLQGQFVHWYSVKVENETIEVCDTTSTRQAKMPVGSKIVVSVEFKGDDNCANYRGFELLPRTVSGTVTAFRFTANSGRCTVKTEDGHQMTFYTNKKLLLKKGMSLTEVPLIPARGRYYRTNWTPEARAASA